jgi:zinc protease
MSVCAIGLLLAIIGADPGPPVASKRLDNGIELLQIDRGLVPLIHFRIAVRLGSAFDPPNKSGLARVATLVIESHLMTLSSSDEPRTIERLGVDLAAETGVASAVFYGSVQSENADRAMPLILEGIVHPPSSENATKNAIARALDERQQALADDRSLADHEVKRMLFRAHAYGRAPRGDVRDIASITADDVLAIVRRQVRGESMILAIAGASLGNLSDRAKQWTDSVPKGKAADMDLGPGPDRPRGRKIVLIDKPERRRAEVCVGQLIPGAPDPRGPAMLAARAALGGSFSSRLLRALDGKQHIALLPVARLDEERTASAFEIAFSAEPSKLPQAVRALFDELGAIEKKGLTEEEMRFGRAYASARAQLELRDPDRALRAVVAARILGLDPLAPFALGHTIDGTGDDELRSGVRLVAAPEDLAIAVVASVTPRLQAELAALPGVKEVSIVSWEDR